MNRSQLVSQLTNGRGPLETPTPNVQREADRAKIERDTFFLRFDIDQILAKLLAGTSRASDSHIQCNVI